MSRNNARQWKDLTDATTRLRKTWAGWAAKDRSYRATSSKRRAVRPIKERRGR